MKGLFAVIAIMTDFMATSAPNLLVVAVFGGAAALVCSMCAYCCWCHKPHEDVEDSDDEEANHGGPKSAEERKREEEDRMEQKSEQQARNAGFARDEGDFKSQIEAAVHEANSDLVAMGGVATVLSCSKAARTISLELTGEFDHKMRMLICRKIGEKLGESVSHEFMMDLLSCITFVEGDFDLADVCCAPLSRDAGYNHPSGSTQNVQYGDTTQNVQYGDEALDAMGGSESEAEDKA